VHFEVRSLYGGFGFAAISLRRDSRLCRPVVHSCALVRGNRANAGLARLYRETEYYEGHRADFSSVDLTRQDFSGLDLRGIKMDRAVLAFLHQIQFGNCAQLVVTRSWQSAFRDDALACGASLPDRVPLE
jgi:hypothetical protein